MKLPLPDRPGQLFVASITVPRAASTAVLSHGAMEVGTTGLREAAVLAESGGPDAVYAPHPYAPRTESKLPWHHADDARYDERFLDHPLSRVRRWLRGALDTVRLDPAFAAQPRFGTPVPVSVGVPIGPFLPLWTADEQVTFWRLEEPDAVRAQLGRGLLNRRPVNKAESCEAAQLDPAGGTLTLAAELPAVRLEAVDEYTAHTSITPQDTGAAFSWIGDLSVAAGERAETMLVRTAAAADGADKYVLMRLQVNHGDRANPLCVVETSPVPVGAEFWDRLTPRASSGKVGVARPRDADHARSDGLLTMWAVQTWDLHPFRLMLSFQPNPDLR